MKTLEQNGRIWFRNALSTSVIDALSQACVSEQLHGTRIKWNSRQASLLRQVTNLHDLVGNLMPGATPVRALAFNKSAETNWAVPWHQDRVIAVKGKHTVDGFKNWTNKSGIWHVEPPVHILEAMVFVRVHLEDSTKENGCMEIAHGSHKYGRILSSDTLKIASSLQTEMCTAKKGDVLVVKALTLHRSHKSEAAEMRRVLRVDYSNQQLPVPLQWAALAA